MPKMQFDADLGKANEKQLEGYYDVPEVRRQVVSYEGDHHECFWCHEAFPAAWGLRFCPRCGFSVDCE